MKAVTTSRLGLVGFNLAIATTLISCSGGVVSEQNPGIKIDGSSTVYPITEAIAQQYSASKAQDVDITVDFSGTGGGFKKFCGGETEVNNASRPISQKEMTACKKAGIAYIELPIAFDALTVVVNPENDWLTSISLQELNKIWSPAAENTVTKWNQVRAELPNKPLNLYAPGEASGTYDYFTEAIVGEEDSRTDYLKSEDDNILVQGIQQDPHALGYLGLAYYESNQDRIRAIAIYNGKGAVLPSRETVEAGEYQPLSRPLFIYINSSAAQKNPALKEFVEMYLEQAPEIVTQIGYVPLPEDGYELTKIHFQRGKVGTVFAGKSAFDLTIGELLRKQATF